MLGLSLFRGCDGGYGRSIAAAVWTDTSTFTRKGMENDEAVYLDCYGSIDFVYEHMRRGVKCDSRKPYR